VNGIFGRDQVGSRNGPQWQQRVPGFQTATHIEDLDSSGSFLYYASMESPHPQRRASMLSSHEIQRLTDHMLCTTTMPGLPMTLSPPGNFLLRHFAKCHAIKYHQERESEIRTEVELEAASLASS
jgi:hypothetical protein